MAVVQGIREKVHLPLYDSLFVDKEEQIFDVEKSGTLKFFVNVQGKTKLQTNLQSASLLPHYNTFEARAMRVVISDLPPVFPDDDKKATASIDGVDVIAPGTAASPGDKSFDDTGAVLAGSAKGPVTASIEVTVDQLAKFYKQLNEDPDHEVQLEVGDENVTLKDSNKSEFGDDTVLDKIAALDGGITLTKDDLDEMNDSLKTKAIPKEQTDPNNGSGTIIGKLVYNTVTSLFVGEKVMISMPTWFFPGGAGPYSETGKFTTHGQPSPNATFRFAEPIYIDKQQNFRVEIEVPDSDTLKEIQKIYGPMNIWVVLDGYMTRDVQ